MSHTQTHQSWRGLSDRHGGLADDRRMAEIRSAEESIAAAAAGTPRPLFRPPYGEYDSAALQLLPSARYSWLIMWTVDSNGWRDWSATAICDRFLSSASWGAIYIFHVGGASRDALALPGIVQGLRAQGYSFASIPQILR